MTESDATARFRAARDQLLGLRGEHERAVAEFAFPDVGDEWNWAIDWFDAFARGNERPGLVVVEEDGSDQSLTFDELAHRSDQVAVWLRDRGVHKGDAVIVMLGNQIELWETMLAVTKVGAVIMPTTTAVGPADLRDRIERGGARFVVCNPADAAKLDDVPGDYVRIGVGPVRGRRRGVARPPRGVRPRHGHRRAPGHRARRPAAPLLHQRHDLAAQAGRAHPGVLSRSATSRRCTGSASSPATSTSTSPRRAGPSTRGRASSRPGTPRRPSWSTTTRASTRPRCSPCCASARSPASARRPRSGGCSSTPTSPAGRARCARSSAPASRSTPR